MYKEICLCSISQPTSTGFIPFVQGNEYDLDKITFHSNSSVDEVIRESLRAKYFKPKPINTNKVKKTGGK